VKNLRSFFSVNMRWGGHILPRFSISISRNFMTVVLLLALLFVALPALAQDATPTADIIVTAVPTLTAPVVTPDVAPTGTVDTAIVFAGLAGVVIIGLGGTALIGYLVKRLGDSVPADKIQGILDSAQKYLYNQSMAAAARSPQAWDDSLVPAVANWFGYDPNVSTPARTPLPPRATPPAPPVIPPAPTTPPFSAPVPQPLGVPLNQDYDLRNRLFTEAAEGQKRIAVPRMWAYYAEGGDSKTHTDAFYDPGQGFKMMLDSRGKLDHNGKPARFGYESYEVIDLYPGTRYTIAPRFDAKISGGAVNIKAALIDGETVLFELPPQRIEPGTYEDKSVVFVFQLSATRVVFNLRLRVYVETEYATLRDDSYIRWRTLPLEAQAPDYGNDAVVRY
jgi:hypothetical protein